jgi:hypothetical protein
MLELYILYLLLEETGDEKKLKIEIRDFYRYKGWRAKVLKIAERGEIGEKLREEGTLWSQYIQSEVEEVLRGGVIQNKENLAESNLILWSR